jgi:DNA-binding response OmpR family regulator
MELKPKSVSIMGKSGIIKTMTEEKPRLLIIDDEADQCALLKNCFSHRNFIVFTATTGRDGIASIKENKPDLVLLDINLPDMNGKDVLYELRKIDKNIKVIIATGCLLSDQEIRELTDLGINNILSKPVDIVALLNIVKDVLKQQYAEFFRLEATKPKEEQLADTSLRSFAHEVANVTNNIATKCELYILDTEEGLKKDKTEKEKVDEAIDVFKAVLKQTERLTDIAKNLSAIAKKES